MKPTRRNLIASMSAMALLPACKGKPIGTVDTGDSGVPEEPEDTGIPLQPTPDRPAEPPAWQPAGEVDADAFAWGVQVGDPTTSSVRVGVWTTEASVGLTLVRGDGETWVEVGEQNGLEPTDGKLQLDLDELEADTVYCVVFYAADGTRRSRVSRFRTGLDADGWRKLTIGATSCLGSADHPWPSMSHLAEEDLDLFLFLGDMVYASHSTSVSDFASEWSDALSTTGMQDVFAHSAVVATWDDHEVTNNFEGLNIEPALLDAALTAFRQAIPQRTGPGGSGLWRKLSWGQVLDVFVLDCRGERDGSSVYISREQMDWLKSGLTNSTARFKFIANSVPITNYYTMLLDTYAEDRWQGYPAQREEILGHIEDNAIGGVLWLTGDFHFGTISRVGAAGEIGENQWEVMVGPSGSTLNPIADIFSAGGGSEQFPVLFSAWNTTRLALDPGRGEVVVTYIGDDGSVLAEKTLTI